MFVARAGLEVFGDEARLKWAIGHLIDNAIKYTLPGGEIVVRCGHLRDGRAALEVSDTGVGIQPKDLPHVFERFYRGEARTPDGRLIDPRGLGQGLYVAKSVVEAHEGYITVASRAGAGTTFTVALPVAETPTEDTLPHQRGGGAAGRPGGLDGAARLRAV
ncbi:MAG: ATP-binding protein [Anaerolineae bacterium]|nr:ATP-binding protein [Anaerolineae bacterium]